MRLVFYYQTFVCFHLLVPPVFCYFATSSVFFAGRNLFIALIAMNTENATIRKFTMLLMNEPILIAPPLMCHAIAPKSGCLKMAAIVCITMSFTSESTILLKAVPITTPTARSITFPLTANALNSSTKFFILICV